MGWIKAGPKLAEKKQMQSPRVQDCVEYKNVEHVEDIADDFNNLGIKQEEYLIQTQTQYLFAPESLKDSELPYISKDEVLSKRRPGAIAAGNWLDKDRKDFWIVVDNVILDCTEFISDHPGGEQVILSFVGEDCSWQFWRFHDRNIMEQYGKPLRIGRTDGALKRFTEPQRFVGLSRLGVDDW